MKNDLTLHRVIADRKPPTVDTWQRPADWLPMPTSFSEEYPEVAILYAVFEGMPALTDFISWSGQAYSIDWGDGVVETKASGETSSHTYIFSALPESSRCSRGYKQVIIRLTSLTSNCTYYFNSANNQPYNHYFLEFLVSGLTANEHFRHIGATPAKFLERYSGGNVFGSELTTTFYNCPSLSSVSMGNIIGNAESFFSNCSSLKYLSFTGYQQASSYYSLFRGCIKLAPLPAPPLSGGLGSFYRETAITEFTGDLSENTSMESMFYSCLQLKRVTFTGISLPPIISYAFYNCPQLEEINNFILNPLSTRLSSMFSNCKSLPILPFSTCPSTVVNFNNFVDGCETLLEIPALDASGNTSTFGNFARNCYKLSRCKMTGINNTISFLNAGLAREAIVEIFNNLATVTGKTITISGTPGAAALTQAERDIALNKGWTITG